jgi:tyrosine-protein phosphatase SIW14
MKTTRLAIVAVATLSISVWGADPQAPGIPNFHQVNERIFRGGQPSIEGWNSLAKMGVGTIIDLRREDEHSTQEEARAVEAAGMHYVNVPLNGVVSPPPEKIAKILALLDSPGVVFVHCKRGADRTGAVIACYRIGHDHWDAKHALSEAKSYGMSMFQVGMKRYVKSYQAGPVTADNVASPEPAVVR